jgi:hypothetical protein
MKKFLFVMAMIWPALCYAQGSYRDGFVITAAGDTLSGLIDYSEGDKPYKSCSFRESMRQKAVTYLPGQLAGYGFTGDKLFETREIRMKGAEPQTVFLEVVVRGALSLYRFESTYLVEKGDRVLRPLLNEKKEEVNHMGVKYISYGREYIGVLKILTNDCAELRSGIDHIRLNEKALTALVEQYNACMGASSITFKAAKPWLRVSPGIIGGVQSSRLGFVTLNQLYEYLKADFEVANSPLFGVSVDLVSPRLSDRHALHAEVSFTSSRYYSYSSYPVSASTRTNEATIRLDQLRIPIGYRYTFKSGALKPFLNLGVSSIFHLAAESTLYYEIKTGDVVNTYTGEVVPVNDTQFGAWFGLGAQYALGPKASALLELRYERTNGITPWVVDPQSYIDSSINNFQILLGLRLW